MIFCFLMDVILCFIVLQINNYKISSARATVYACKESYLHNSYIDIIIIIIIIIIKPTYSNVSIHEKNMSTESIQRYRNVNEKPASVAFLCHQVKCVWAFVIGNGTRT